LARNFGFLDRLCRRSDAESLARLSSRSRPARVPFRVNLLIRGERGPHFTPAPSSPRDYRHTLSLVSTPRGPPLSTRGFNCSSSTPAAAACTATAAASPSNALFTLTLSAQEPIRACFSTLGAPAMSDLSCSGSRLVAKGSQAGHGHHEASRPFAPAACLSVVPEHHSSLQESPACWQLQLYARASSWKDSDPVLTIARSLAHCVPAALLLQRFDIDTVYL
jgi:hypothetical protein